MVVGAVAQLAGAATTPQRANLWVGPGAGSCTRAASPAPYRAAAACRDLNAAYGAARNGDLVLYRGGRYRDGEDPLVDHNPRIKAGGRPVVVRPQAGAKVILDMQGRSADFKGVQSLTIDGGGRWTFYRGSPGVIPQNGSSCGVLSNRVTLENLTINGALSTRNARNLVVRNVDIGNFSYPAPGQDAWGDSSRVGDYDCGPANIAAHVTFDHVHWHDIYRGKSPSHAECLFIESSNDVTVKNSRLDRCPIIGLFLKNDSQNGARNYQRRVTIENDVITKPCPTGPRAGNDECGTFGIQEADCDNNSSNPAAAPPMSWTIRFNTLTAGAQLWLCEPPQYWASTSRLYGNLAEMLWTGVGATARCSLGTKPPTLANWSVGFNVWTRREPSPAGQCAKTDVSSADPKATRDLVPVSQGCPATDVDGRKRPTTGFCDAGATQH